MIEGKDLILATKPFAQENRKLSWLYTLSSFGLLITSYVTSVLVENLWLKFTFAGFAGLLNVRVFVIYHDYLHKAILANSILAKSIFSVFGLYMLAPISIWRRSHDYHHKHNSKLYSSSIGSFPIVSKTDFAKATRYEQRLYLFIRHPITINLGYIFAFVYGMCIKSFIANPRKHWDSLLSLAFHVSLGASIYYFFGLPSLLISFFIPALMEGAIGSYLFYAQHNFPDVEFQDKYNWSYDKAALASSSMMKMHRISHWMSANIGYHHIHHMNAKIPFYRLPEVYKAFEEFQNPKTTSLLPKDVLACFKLKVWDPDQRKMIGLKELRLQGLYS